MGQYHIIVNLDKQEYLDPHKFGDGLKLMEFGGSGDGAMLGLAVLLAKDNGRGGGDLRSDDPIIGSWAGDRIEIAGDYGDKIYKLHPEDVEDGQTPCNLYEYAYKYFDNIGNRVIAAIVEGEGKHTSLSRLNLSSTGWRNKD